MSGRFLESTSMGFARAITRAMLAEKTAQQRGFLQALDPRVRVVGLLSLVLAVTLARRLGVVGALFALAVLIAVTSCVSFRTLGVRVWLVVLGFTGVIALPAVFLTPGTTLTGAGPNITQQGIRSAGMLILRVETAVTFTTLLVLTTRWTHVLKALRALRLPREAVMMLAMTHRYVFLLVETAVQMLESRRSRTVGKLSPALQRGMAARTAGVLLSKSVETSNEVYAAMQSRGFRGEVRVLTGFRMTLWDYVALLLFIATAGVAVWQGR